MSLDWIIRIILFAIVHWVLAGIMVNDLSSRQRVFGGRKAPWAIVILFLPCFGSLIYLAFHPQILSPDQNDKNHRNRDKFT
jgi:hypothetical protein